MSNCEALEVSLRSGPVSRDLDFYYHPHVTVAHNVSDESLDRAFIELADYSVTFEVGAFHLYELGADGVWRPVDEFTLTGRLTVPDTQRLLDRLKGMAPYRAWTRFTESSGNLLAAGVSYYAFFSIFPALALAFAIFGFVLQGRPDLVADIANSLNSAFPGMIKTPTTPTASSASRHRRASP